MLPSKAPNNYSASRQLIGGDDFNNVVNQLNSSASALTAKAGGGQATALQLNAAVNVVDTVATAADSVKLPKGFAGLEVWIQNTDADGVQVFTYKVGTIDGTNGVTTGVLQAQGTKIYKCMYVNPTTGAEQWISK